MIISRTPFRISFFGGGTDFPDYFNEYEGAVLSSTIDKYCYLSVHPLTTFFTHRFRASYARTESVIRPDEFEHPLVRECLLLLDIKEGIEISHVADLPGRTGLGTSSAFTIGLLNALHSFFSRIVSPEQLAREAVIVERERVGDIGGWQDQYASAFGGLNITRFTKEGVKVIPLQLSATRQREFEQNLLLFYMGSERSSKEILRVQQSRSKANIPALKTMYSMVDKAADILRGSGSCDAFGELLHESWTLKKSLSRTISNSTIDEAYAAARQAGALGGKLLGAGGSGFLCLYVPPEKQSAIRQTLSALPEVNFKLSRYGSRIIFMSDE